MSVLAIREHRQIIFMGLELRTPNIMVVIFCLAVKQLHLENEQNGIELDVKRFKTEEHIVIMATPSILLALSSTMKDGKEQ